VFFDATAEYHRSDESSDSCAVPAIERCMRGAEHRSTTSGGCASGYRSFTRGWAPKFERFIHEQARERFARVGPDHPTLFTRTRHRPRPGAVVFPPCGGGRSSDQRRAASSHRQAGGATRAPGSCRRLHGGAGTGALRGFLPTGAYRVFRPQAADDGTDVPVAEVARSLPRAGCLTEVSPGAQDTQREHNDTSHGVRFLSAR